MSCGVAVCLSLSFACRLVRFSSLRLVWRLVACPSCLAGWGGVACLLFSSGLLFSCRRAWRSFSSRSRLVERLVGVSSSMMCPLRRRGVLAYPIVSVLLRGAWLSVVPGRLVVIVRLISGCSSRVVWRGVVPVSLVVSSHPSRGGGEVFGFSFYHGGSGWAVVPVVPPPHGVLACLGAVGDGAMPFSSSAFPPPPAFYHPMAAGHVLRAVSPYLAHRRLLLAPGGYRSHLVSLARLETTGRETGRRAAWLSGRG